MRFGRLADKVHARFLRRAAAFLVIAPKTRRDDVVPAFLSSQRYRHNMIKRKIFGRKLFPAVLACVIIARIYIRAGEFDAVQVLYADVLEEANDRRQLDCERDGMNLVIVFFNDLYFPSE